MKCPRCPVPDLTVRVVTRFRPPGVLDITGRIGGLSAMSRVDSSFVPRFGMPRRIEVVISRTLARDLADRFSGLHGHFNENRPLSGTSRTLGREIADVTNVRSRTLPRDIADSKRL